MAATCNEILMARNRTRVPHKIYLYEAEKNMLQAMGCGSVSDTVHGILAAFLSRTGHRMEFLKTRDRLIIDKIRRGLSYNK